MKDINVPDFENIFMEDHKMAIYQIGNQICVPSSAFEKYTVVAKYLQMFGNSYGGNS